MADPIASRGTVPAFAFLGLLGGNVVLAFGPLLVRLADVGPVATGFWRLTLSLPVLLLLAGRARAPLPGWRQAGLLVVAGLFFGADLAAWHSGILHTKIANATVFGNLSSLILPLWGIFILRQRPGRMQVLALSLALAGAILLMGSSYELSPRNFVGDLLCALAGLLYAGYLLSVQRARDRMDSWSVLAMASAAGAPFVLIVALLLGETVLPRDWTPLVVLALSSQVVGQGLMVYALAWFSPLVIGLTLLLQPAVGVVVGWVVFGETIGLVDLTGLGAIAVALVLVRLPARP